MIPDPDNKCLYCKNLCGARNCSRGQKRPLHVPPTTCFSTCFVLTVTPSFWTLPQNGHFAYLSFHLLRSISRPYSAMYSLTDSLACFRTRPSEKVSQFSIKLSITCYLLHLNPTSILKYLKGHFTLSLRSNQKFIFYTQTL